jgi:hypothetical protein
VIGITVEHTLRIAPGATTAKVFARMGTRKYPTDYEPASMGHVATGQQSA